MFAWTSAIIAAGIVVLAGWIAVQGKLPGERRRQPSPPTARAVAVVMLVTLGAGAAGWRSMSEEPVPPWSLRTVGASVLVLQVVPLVLNWRYPLERELRRREKARAEPTTPFRWQWVLKALVISIVLALAALVAADAIADIITG